MDIHKNARLSFRSRELLVQRVVERAVPPRPPASGCGAFAPRAARGYWIAPRDLIAVRVACRKQ